jgi:uncharacterized membrane protein YfcA
MTITTVAILFICTSLTAIISAVSGMGGGIVLLSIMTLFMPLGLIVPIHGVVQLFSNTARTYLLRIYVIKKIFAWFCVGLPIGTIIAIKIIKSVENKDIFLLLIAALILYSVFRPKKMPEIKLPYWGFIFVGTAVGILGPLIGATGPMIAPFFMRDDFNKEEIVATKSSVQTVGHLVKLPAFIYLGFDYLGHSPAIIALVIAAIIGTKIGVKLLGKIKEHQFKLVFKVALLFAAVRILYKVFI